MKKQKKYKQKNYKQKGSITVFLTMMLLLVASCFFALLEAARLDGIGTKADVVHDNALESLFAEYQKTIYQDYGLLFLDASYGTDELQIERMEERLEKKNGDNLFSKKKEIQEFYQLRITDCQIKDYLLATDQGGKIFRSMASDVAKRESFGILAQDYTAKNREKNELKKGNSSVDEYLKSARDAGVAAQEEAEKKKKEAEKEGKDMAPVPTVAKDASNPINQARKWKKKGILSLTVKDDTTLSEKMISTENSLLNREKEKGTLPAKGSITDEFWFFQYLETHFGNYQSVKEDRPLDYEMEYILAGKETDLDNLKKTIKNIIKIREIMNLAYLAQDASKQQQADAMATTMMGWTLNPAVILATKWGLLAAWAYVESILDARALLEGNQIAWFKDASQWTSDLGNLSGATDGFLTAKNCENGWNYTEYLKFLLFLKEDKQVNYRSMDLIEANILLFHEESIRMDTMLAACRTSVDYQAQPLFWRYITIKKYDLSPYEMHREKEYSY